jgi:hypothetical protein
MEGRMMIRGLDGFKLWFQGYEQHFAIIGGTACDVLMSEAGSEFRATRDIDIVLFVEALNIGFGARFWDYIKSGGYEHRRSSIGAPQFYRFTRPNSQDFPYMIELFSRRVDSVTLPTEAALTPLPIEEDISSLSAILLDDSYYAFMKSGVRIIDGLPILDAPHLIPFKAKAWLDLSLRKANGSHVDGKHIKKHKNDVIALTALLQADLSIELPENIRADLLAFVTANANGSEKLQRVIDVFGM